MREYCRTRHKIIHFFRGQRRRGLLKEGRKGVSREEDRAGDGCGIKRRVPLSGEKQSHFEKVSKRGQQRVCERKQSRGEGLEEARGEKRR